MLIVMEPMREKETKNYARYGFGRIVSSEEEITGTVYLPKKAHGVKVTVEYTLD